MSLEHIIEIQSHWSDPITLQSSKPIPSDEKLLDTYNNFINMRNKVDDFIHSTKVSDYEAIVNFLLENLDILFQQIDEIGQEFITRSLKNISLFDLSNYVYNKRWGHLLYKIVDALFHGLDTQITKWNQNEKSILELSFAQLQDMRRISVSVRKSNWKN